MGLAALAAWHQVRVASPGVLQRLGWRNGAHSASSQGRRRGRHDLGTAPTVAPCEVCSLASANARDALSHSKTIQRRGDGCPVRVGRD
eukprot:scaffold128_cov60-Phaeocystis_antarctica.AAC.3